MNKKKLRGRVGQHHHVVPSQFSTLVVDDEHITSRAAKIIRPMAFITGQEVMMREAYEKHREAIELKKLKVRLSKLTRP